MRLQEIIIEGKNHPCIVVDVQPEYADYSGNICRNAVKFANGQTGKILMFVNAEDQQFSGDTVNDIVDWWEMNGFSADGWNRVEIVDKGYGYLRSWMDNGIPENQIIKTIRLMYGQKVSDSRQLFGGEDSKEYESSFQQFLGSDFQEFVLYDPLIVGWTSVSKLKEYNGAYIFGGGRNECLREVELLMNAFNIKYKRIDSLVY